MDTVYKIKRKFLIQRFKAASLLQRFLLFEELFKANFLMKALISSLWPPLYRTLKVCKFLAVKVISLILNREVAVVVRKKKS